MTSLVLLWILINTHIKITPLLYLEKQSPHLKPTYSTYFYCKPLPLKLTGYLTRACVFKNTIRVGLGDQVIPLSWQSFIPILIFKRKKQTFVPTFAGITLKKTKKQKCRYLYFEVPFEWLHSAVQGCQTKGLGPESVVKDSNLTRLAAFENVKKGIHLDF